MQPNQTAIKLSLNKTVVTVLTRENMMNHHGGINVNFATKTDPPPPPPPDPDTVNTCFTCNSLVPEGCGTGTTGIIGW